MIFVTQKICHAANVRDLQVVLRFFIDSIDYEGSSYLGCFVFDDSAFCSQIVRLLRGYLNRPIAEIGRLVLTYTL
jgi:hypothetical protein